MHRLALVLLMSALALPSRADDACAVRAARLLSQGLSDELATWFVAPPPGTGRALAHLSNLVGRLEQITAVDRAKPGKTFRRSIMSRDLPSTYSYWGSWAEATSQKLGWVQIEASVEIGTDCRLLALHLDQRSD